LYNKYNTLEKVKIDFKTVLYAPSWSSNPEMVIMTEELLNELSEQKDFKVILKPHPNLFLPDKCSGKDWNIIFSKLNKANLTVINTTEHPIQKYMLDADVLLADISSVIFEYLYCDRPIVLHKNEAAIKYYQAEDMYAEISRAAFLFEKPSMVIETVKYALSKPELHSTQRKEILHTKFYNIGKATEAAVSAIYKHLGLPCT
jgi:CDP-glycerol glycerophosphotransferase (TagB/SpsB family)